AGNRGPYELYLIACLATAHLQIGHGLESLVAHIFERKWGISDASASLSPSRVENECRSRAGGVPVIIERSVEGVFLASWNAIEILLLKRLLAGMLESSRDARL